MALYQHRQTGMLTRAAFVFGAAVVVIALLLAPESRYAMGPALVLMTLGAWLFGSLSVEVRGREIAVWFGPGLIRRRIRLEDVAGVRVVRNHWYNGWGIRLIPSGWMFNVSGFDAVELELRNGHRFRIGTDEPRRLAAAVEEARRRSTS